MSEKMPDVWVEAGLWKDDDPRMRPLAVMGATRATTLCTERYVPAARLASAQETIRRMQAVVDAAKLLTDNAEEYDCDGLGLFAQHGWWEPLHDALAILAETAPEKGEG